MKKDVEEVKKIMRVKIDWFEFWFKEVLVDDVGVDGKLRDGMGWRYGVLYEDWKCG